VRTSLYKCKGISYANDRNFAKIAATFATKTVYNTAAVAIFQTAYYAVLSVVTLPITILQSEKPYDYTTHLQTATQVIRRVFSSAIWKEPKTLLEKKNPSRTEWMQTALVEARVKASKALETHKREIVIGGVAIAAVITFICLYHFGMPKQAIIPPTPSAAPAPPPINRNVPTENLPPSKPLPANPPSSDSPWQERELSPHEKSILANQMSCTKSISSFVFCCLSYVLPRIPMTPPGVGSLSRL